MQWCERIIPTHGPTDANRGLNRTKPNHLAPLRQGTPSTLLDGAVQAVADGGLLLITATDMAVLCGNNGEVCWTKYGSYPLRAKYCHEQALRILLASIDAAAGRYKRHIVPVLSVSVDFYIRCFGRVYTSAKDAKLAPTKVSYCYQCVGCDTYAMQPVGRTATKASGPSFLLPPPAGART